MIVGELRQRIDRLWDACWSNGVTNPVEIVDQITGLILARMLEPDRWAALRAAPTVGMPGLLAEVVYPALAARSERLSGLRYALPTAGLCSTAVDVVDGLPLQSRDTAGDLYEYMLNRIATSGRNGQFRTPAHIIALIVAMADPRPGDVACDPACGSGGFLAAAVDRCPDVTVAGWDVDPTMIRLATANMLLRGATAEIGLRNGITDPGGDGAYSLVLANPPFAGTVDAAGVDPALTGVVRSRKSELLFLARILRLLTVGGRAAVVVPDGVLFGSSNAHRELRRILVDGQRLDAVVKLPGGVFKPYAGVSTAVLFFTRTDSGGTDAVWFYEVTADGWSLDDKRNPLLPAGKLGAIPDEPLTADEHAKNNLPDVLARWRNRDAETTRPRTAQSFCVSRPEIVAQGYDLSLNRYKEVVHEEIEHRPPAEILANLRRLDAEIRDGLDELDALLSGATVVTLPGMSDTSRWAA